MSGLEAMSGAARKASKRPRNSEDSFDMEMKDSEKLLYICTSVRDTYTALSPYRYQLQAIRLSDLFDVIENRPIKEEILELITCLAGDEVPGLMSFSVFESRIVLAGGHLVERSGVRYTGNTAPTYALETDPLVRTFISTRSKPKLPRMVPELDSVSQPWLREIDGKLYSLSRDTSFGKYVAFKVFDPNTNEWAPLAGLPAEDFGSLDTSYCLVIGTKIFVTLLIQENFRECIVKIVCFDVAHPEKKWTRLKEQPVWKIYSSFPAAYCDALVVDSEDVSEKLMFTYDFSTCKIVVHLLMVSSDGEPNFIKLLDTVSVPCNPEGQAYSCVYLGDQTVCFSFLYGLTLHVFAFKYFYSIGAMYRTRSFYVERSGYRLFDHTSRLGSNVFTFDLVGCALL